MAGTHRLPVDTRRHGLLGRTLARLTKNITATKPTRSAAAGSIADWDIAVENGSRTISGS